MRKIVFTNDKGGVAKTVTVANMAVGLAGEGYKVLAIDLDQQGDLTKAILGVRPPLIEDLPKESPEPRTTYTLLIEKYSLKDVMIKAPRYDNLHVAPSNSDLQDANGKLANKAGSQTNLYHILSELGQNTFDFVLIDTGKGFDSIVINALAAADEVLVLVSPGSAEMDAVDRMNKNIQKVREKIFFGADHPTLAGVILTRFEKHHTVSEDTKTVLEEKYPKRMFSTIIPRNDDLSKAYSRSKSIFEFMPSSKGALAYKELMKEIVAYGN